MNVIEESGQIQIFDSFQLSIVNCASFQLHDRCCAQHSLRHWIYHDIPQTTLFVGKSHQLPLGYTRRCKSISYRVFSKEYQLTGFIIAHFKPLTRFRNHSDRCCGSSGNNNWADQRIIPTVARGQERVQNQRSRFHARDMREQCRSGECGKRSVDLVISDVENVLDTPCCEHSQHCEKSLLRVHSLMPVIMDWHPFSFFLKIFGWNGCDLNTLQKIRINKRKRN